MTDPLPYHPLANLFPLIEGKDFEEFCAGIKADGRLHDKIVLLDGQILDGRNRYRACTAVGMTAHTRTFDPKVEGDPLNFVISKNLHRRHLSASQRAMLAADIETYRHGGNRRDDQDANLHVERDRAARVAGASPRSVASAAKVRDQGTPELGNAVRQGDLAVSAAAEIASLPVDEQKAKIAAIAKAPDTKKAFSGVVKDLRREKQAEKQERRGERETELAAKIAALPDKRYGVILADPEWRFEPRSRETGMDRAADNHYPTSETDDIAARPVASIAADDCVLFLWATAPMLPDAMRVLAAWAFTYKTHVVWKKVYPGKRMGTGYWVRIDHELLLIGTRGNPPAPAQGAQWPTSVIHAEWTGVHSEKPDLFHKIIEGYFPNLPKIELNARTRRPGWDSWGTLEHEDRSAATDAEGTAPTEPAADEGSGQSPSGDVGIDAPPRADAPAVGSAGQGWNAQAADVSRTETGAPELGRPSDASEGLSRPQGGLLGGSRTELPPHDSVTGELIELQPSGPDDGSGPAANTAVNNGGGGHEVTTHPTSAGVEVGKAMPDKSVVASAPADDPWEIPAILKRTA